ncbi:MAG: UDP-N-acetylmuramate--L-alanine ligase, partial [Chloroflexi bacterium]
MQVMGVSPGGRVHLVGIGGAGLSAIARVLMGAGYRVSGSDRRASALTEALRAEGATVYIGHRADQVRGADLVIVSSAVPPDNPEVVAARQAGIPVVKRDRVLGSMMAGRVGLAVAGTHGKTTTTAMIASVLLAAGLDPTFIVGGVLMGPETNARYGSGPHFVIEADEYDRTFLGLRPQVSVVTNVEHDHPDCYPSYEEVVDAFTAFVRLLPPEGRLVLCADDPGAMGLAAAWEGEVITYG